MQSFFERFLQRYPRLRLLPALIFIAVLMLGVRTGDLWFGLSAPAIDLGRPTMAEDPPGPPPVAEVAEAAKRGRNGARKREGQGKTGRSGRDRSARTGAGTG